jgi:hypothetical protein
MKVEIGLMKKEPAESVRCVIAASLGTEIALLAKEVCRAED